jgi:cytochrome c-type protein NapC
MTINPSPLTLLTLACAIAAAAIIIWYLIRQPHLVGATKVWLLLGLGVFPLGVAAAGNIQGFEATKERRFCGSCHVMIPHASDSNDLASTSLASRHARNHLFGETNCYSCHADYGMFGTVLTKLGGLRHVWLYVTEYRNTPLEEAKKTIHLVRPYPNDNCMQCHSTELPVWQRVPDHRSSLLDVRNQRVSCASAGCHGYAHPLTKPNITAQAPKDSHAIPSKPDTSQGAIQ